MHWYQKSNHGGLYEHSICIAVIAETFGACVVTPSMHTYTILRHLPVRLGLTRHFARVCFCFVRAADSCVCVCAVAASRLRALQ